MTELMSIFTQFVSNKNKKISIEDRIFFLKKIEEELFTRKGELLNAVDNDFNGRSHFETKMLELLPLAKEISHIKKHIKKWVEPKKKNTSILFYPGKSFIYPEPLGTIGIISPWNYPIYLAISPILGAIAAGNRVMIKLSEYSPNTNKVIQTIFEKISPDYVLTIEGGADVAEEFSNLPFDLTLFTGATAIGQKVMTAASKNLTPVILELGGKSPAIIDKNFCIKRAAQSIVKGKCLNSGQTCVAPDHVFVHQEKMEEFISYAIEEFQKLYPNYADNADYTSIINDKSYNRLFEYIKNTSGRVIFSDTHKTDKRRLPLILIVNPGENDPIHKEEIFGPILPIYSYESLSEVISTINMSEKPLALYSFSDSRSVNNKILRNTSAGGVTINDTMLHVAQHSLPFGGVGKSGMGSYHGIHSFNSFSNKKSVFVQTKLNSYSILTAPYMTIKNRILDFILNKKYIN